MGYGTVLIRRVSCVRFSPNPVIPVIVSAGWDKVVKVSLFPLRPTTTPFPLPRCDAKHIFATSEGLPNETNYITKISDLQNSSL
jgi:hypothetical protein